MSFAIKALTPENKGILYGSLGALAAGFFIVFWQKATVVADWRQMLFLLFAFSALIHVIYVPLKFRGNIKEMLRFSRDDMICAAIIAIAAILGNLGSAAAVTSMSAPLVAAFVRFEVLFVSLIGFLVLGERLTVWFFAGFAVVVCGMIYTLPAGAIASSTSDAILYSLLAAASFGTITVAGRYFRASIDIVKVNLLRILLCLGYMATITDLSFIGEASWQPLYTYVAICAVAGPFLSRLFKLASNRTVSAGYTALTALLQPVFAFGISLAIIPSYTPGFAEIIGSTIMLLGIFIALIPNVQTQLAKLRAPAKAA